MSPPSLTVAETNAQANARTNARTWAATVWALYLGSLFTFALTAIAGLIIAYVKRRDLAGTPYESHITSAIRTFWISLGVSIIALVLIVAGIAASAPVVIVLGGCISALLGLWQIFRGVRGLIRAVDGDPIADPTGWL
jgi:uncharacterized membrane protein